MLTGSPQSHVLGRESKLVVEVRVEDEPRFSGLHEKRRVSKIGETHEQRGFGIFPGQFSGFGA